jgi:hypothetical protein
MHKAGQPNPRPLWPNAPAQIDFFRAMVVIEFVNAFQAAVLSGASIITTSLGASIASESMSSMSLAADGAYDAGVIVFASAGNSGCGLQLPGGFGCRVWHQQSSSPKPGCGLENGRLLARLWVHVLGAMGHASVLISTPCAWMPVSWPRGNTDMCQHKRHRIAGGQHGS